MPSNFLNYVKQMFGVSPKSKSAPAATPARPRTSHDYLIELDKILRNNQSKLEEFVENLKIKFLKRNMLDISFIKSPTKKVKFNIKKVDPIPGPTNTNLDFSKDLPTTTP